MTEYTHTLSDKYVDRFIRQRYEKFSEEILPKGSTKIKYYENRSYAMRGDKKLIGILEECFGFIRIEPENPYRLHTLAPTARGRNSNKILVRFQGGHESLWEYSPILNSFTPIYKKEKKNDVMNTYMIISMVMDRGNIGQKYGDFGFTLSLLDAGHYIENINQVLGNYNKAKEIIINPKEIATGDINSVFINNKCYYPIFSIKLKEPVNKVKMIPLSERKVEKKELIFENLEPLNLVDKILSKMKEEKPKMKNEKSNEKYNFYQVLNSRTSSQSYQGCSFFKRNLTDSELNQILKLLSNALKENNFNMEVYLLIKKESNNDLEEYRKELVRVKRDRVVREEILENYFGEVIHDSHDYLNTEDATLIAWTSIPSTMNEINMGDLFHILIESSVIIHRLSLYLTEIGLATRPVKNINEKLFENIITKGKSVSTYMLIAGESMNDVFMLNIN